MSALTVTAKGQVTFKRDLVQHLGVTPGEQLTCDKLPDGGLLVRAAQPSGSIDTFLGFLSSKTSKVATLKEIGEAAAAGWAARQ
ncbi:MAG: type II toxin-antitoxin system PrlF family antitoxin [Burkholderiaceae bacterium]|jgi:hypothetical protein|nr:type II toxin-antitoxin system PrlF family antitoxin [Burkholderiaceae bacterium]